MTLLDDPGLFEPLYEPRTATLSPCGRYRYTLTRRWAPHGPVCVLIMLNPSVADAQIDDPTIRRCMDFARQLGCSALHVVNLYAYRATDPAQLRIVDDPIGVDNHMHLRSAAVMARDTSGHLIAAWGAHADPDRAAAVAAEAAAIAPLHCLGRTKHGIPRHPLFLPKTAKLTPWFPQGIPTHAAQEAADNVYAEA